MVQCDWSSSVPGGIETTIADTIKLGAAHGAKHLIDFALRRGLAFDEAMVLGCPTRTVLALTRPELHKRCSTRP